MGEAIGMLQELAGNMHDVVTGVCLIHLRNHRQSIFSERTRVKFRKLSVREIKSYLQKIYPLDKAGGYAIQEHGEEVVEKVIGSYTNVVGLPLERLQQELPAFVASPELA